MEQIWPLFAREIRKNVVEENALDYVAGYFIVNELSEREWQAEREGQWTKGKSHDTFAPLGPWFVTADDIADPGDVNLKLTVNGGPAGWINKNHDIWGREGLELY